MHKQKVEVVAEETRGNLRYRVFEDEDPMDPEEGEENVLIVFNHRQFNRMPRLLDRRALTSLLNGDDEYDLKEDWFLVPLTAHIHGGVSLSVGFSCGWDRSHGWVIVRKSWLADHEKHFREHLKGTTHEEWASELARGHVETYDKYLNGGFYRYMIERRVASHPRFGDAWEDIDACGSFDSLELAIEEATLSLNFCVEKEEKTAATESTTDTTLRRVYVDAFEEGVIVDFGDGRTVTVRRESWKPEEGVAKK